MMLLHGEERVEVFRPLKAGVKYVALSCVSDVADKVKGMLLSFETNLYEHIYICHDIYCFFFMFPFRIFHLSNISVNLVENMHS